MRYIILCYFSLLLFSCGIDQVKLPNKMKGLLEKKMDLKFIDSKSFLLDSVTAPQPHYIQLFQDPSGVRHLTFLNHYNNTIYSYNYDSLNIENKLLFDKEGDNAVKDPMGYYIRNMDSIYILSKFMKILLANGKGKVHKSISLIAEHSVKNPQTWAMSFPQYFMSTAKPFMQTKTELLITGVFGGDIPNLLVDNFKFTGHFDFKLDSIYFTHTYPFEIYGNNYNWGGSLPMEIFPLLHPNGDKIIYSFVPSHDLYLSDLSGSNEYEKIYAGSNFSGTISSLEKKTKKMGAQGVVSRFVKEDRYCSILYDPYRHVYYRILRKALPNAPKGTHWKEKDIVVIILDEDFEYLGETNLGPGSKWHWQNIFVSKEGMNIEFIDEKDYNENYLNLKVFVPQKIY